MKAGYGGGVAAYLALNEVTDSGLGHDGDGDGGHDVLDHLRVGHAGYAALDADIGGHALERHDGAGAGLLSDAGLGEGLLVSGIAWKGVGWGSRVRLTCSTLTTSMMTPPCNIRARPVFTVKESVEPLEPLVAVAPLTGNSVAIVVVCTEDSTKECLKRKFREFLGS